MDWFTKDEEEKPEPGPVQEAITEPSKPRMKDETICWEEGCFEPLAPGQNQVCQRHIRAG